MNCRLILFLCLCCLKISHCKKYLVKATDQSNPVEGEEPGISFGNDYQAVMQGYPCNCNDYDIGKFSVILNDKSNGHSIIRLCSIHCVIFRPNTVSTNHNVVQQGCCSRSAME